MKEILLDKAWVKELGYTCFSGDSKPFYLSRDVVWAGLWEWTRGEEDSENCPMYSPQLIAIPKALGNDKEKIQKFLVRTWK